MTSVPTKEAPSAVAGDLSRRVAHRRHQLGLSIEHVAQKAGIDPNYLEYLESNADARLSAGSLVLLSWVLQTTPEALLGASAEPRRHRGRAGRHPQLRVLTQEQCEVHLRVGGVGRLVYVTERGPVAHPVNFEYAENQVVFSTDDAKAARLETIGRVGFEVDRIDEAVSEGWSVLVSGPVHRVSASDGTALSSIDLESWAGDERHSLVAITPATITGRVIVHDGL